MQVSTRSRVPLGLVVKVKKKLFEREAYGELIATELFEYKLSLTVNETNVFIR